ncbi:MAG: ABC transporter permease [Eubacteriales bacterium]|nr:ABC transporter permease [Eubacteriales bacterium]
MEELANGFIQAIRMLVVFDPEIYEIVGLSLRVSLSSVLISTCIGVPVGVLYGLYDFFGKKALIRITYTLMSLPPVIAGLVVFLFIMRKGPLGSLRLSFTPTAMIIAQICLVLPIIIGLTYNVVKEKAPRVRQVAATLGAGQKESIKLLIFEVRVAILAAIVTGAGRAISEVGAVMLVGGNIVGKTRVMTTYIAQLQRMGNFDRAIAVGLVLLLIAFILNATLYHIQEREAGI